MLKSRFRESGKIQISMPKRIIVILVILLGATQTGHAKYVEDKFEQIDPISQAIAKAYLDSCPQNSILFAGDEYFSALIFIQEVFLYRNDVTLINPDRLDIPSYYIPILDKLKEEGLEVNLSKNILRPQGQITFPLNIDETRVTNLAGLDEHFNNDSLFIKKDSIKLKYFPGRDMGILESDFLYRFKSLENRPDLTRQHIAWRWKKDHVSRGELLTLLIISKAVETRPVTFTAGGNQSSMLGLDRYLVQYGLAEILQPMIPVRLNGQPQEKIVIESPIVQDFVMNMKGDNQFKFSIPTSFGRDVLRPLLLNEARFSLTQNDTIQALEKLNLGVEVLDLETFGISNEIYAIGELFVKLDQQKQGQFLMDAYLTNVIASLERSFVSTKVAQRRAVNATAKQLKIVREIIQAHLAKYPERSDYWNNRLAKLKAQRKIWSQNIDLD